MPEEAVDHDQYIKKAKALVAETFNQRFETSDMQTIPEDFYIVWFVKVLGNWKAMVSTDIVNGFYWEVTYNGVKQETYVDQYIKDVNRGFSDSSYEGLLAYNASLPRV